MKKFTKIAAAVTAIVLTFGIVGCAADKNANYPDFIHSSDSSNATETSEKYTINVRSAGGMKLNGVRVSAYNSAGTRVRTGISSDGVITLRLTLGEYTLVVEEDSLPDGYYLEEGVTYKTNPEKRDPVDISIPSAVIKQAAVYNKLYSVGEIVNDFVLEDYRTYDGTYGNPSYTGAKNYKLSELLKTKKAVILNFWYPTCINCTLEFPYLEAAYETVKNDVEVLGICRFGPENKQDIADYVETHSKDFNLTFPLGLDPSGLASKYSVSGWPTTVVIDRYGMLACWEEGAQPSLSYWSSLFKTYASDDYVQNIENSENPGGPITSPSDQEKPDVTMPSSADMAAAASATGLNAVYKADEDDEYAWPWTTANDDIYGPVITPTNSGKQNSYATLYVEIPLKKDDLLSFDYMVSSELNGDKLYVLLDGQLLNSDGWSGEIGWTSADIYVADRDRTVELTFIYTKDEGDLGDDSVGEDTAKIKNIRTSKVSADTEALDVIRQAASGTVSAGKYEHYVTPVLGDDGFYHVDAADGPLLYISISNITPWSALHTTDNRFETDYGLMYASLYTMTFYKYSNTVSDDETNSVLSFTVDIGGRDFADPVAQYQHILTALEEPYQLMPVSVQLKEWAESFAAEYEKELGVSSHENEWLEFCFYYDHYGKEHGKDEVCMMDTDVTKGLTVYNSIDVGFRSTPAVGETIKTHTIVAYPLSRPNAVYYKFTALADGVYQIRDYGGGSAYPELEVMVMSEDGSLTTTGFYNGVSDFDQLTGVSYNSFNTYLVLSEGQTVYLGLRIDEQTTGEFDFGITYYDTIDKLMNSSTANGAWTYDEKDGSPIYLGVKAAYDSATDRYFLDDGNGNPDRDCPVYINMVYANFFMSDLSTNYYPIEKLIQLGLFENIGTDAQSDMVAYLQQAKQNSGEYYGLVEADSRIVEILNSLIDINVDGGAGDNRGWLAFACHMEHYAHDAANTTDGGTLTVGWNEIAPAENGAATVTFTAPDAGIYKFGVPDGTAISANGESLSVTDGTATVLLLKGETVTVTVETGLTKVSLPVFKSVNMHESSDGGDLYTGNNIIGKFSESGDTTVTFTAEEAGEYEIDLSDFASATVTVESSPIAISGGVAKVVLVCGQKATVTVTPHSTADRIIFTVAQTKALNQVDDGKTIKLGDNIIGDYNKDGTATVTLESVKSETEYQITITDCDGAPEITLNGEAVTVSANGNQTVAVVTVKINDTVEITVKKGSGYIHTRITVGYPDTADND